MTPKSMTNTMELIEILTAIVVADLPYTTFVLKGTSEQKCQALSQAKRYSDNMHVVVANYESAWQLKKELFTHDADLIIEDERQKIKENRKAQSKALCYLEKSPRAPPLF